MQYIVTFFSHFGAVRLKKENDAAGIPTTLMPVPRTLSSSCGTCATFTCDVLPPIAHPDEVEQVVEVHGEDNYTTVFSAPDE